MVKTYPAIDAHCHIYPDRIAKKAADNTGIFYDMPVNHDGSVATLLSVGDDAGIDRFVVQSVATSPSQVRSINEFIASSVIISGGRFTGLGTLHPESDDIEGDVEQIIKLGLHGVKLHPDIQKFKIDDYRYLKMYELCEGRLPMLIHTGDSRFDYSNPNRLIPILDIYPKLIVIGAHFGGWSVWEEAADKLAGYKNLYVDTCSSLYAFSPETGKMLVRKYGAEKVLFGSDFPMWTPGIELDRFFELDLTDEETRMILCDNAVRVYNMDNKL